MSRRSIHNWTSTGQLERDVDSAPPRKAAPRSSKLDLYKPIIAERLLTCPELSAVRLFEEIRAATGRLRPVPPAPLEEVLRSDYARMREMYFTPPLAFDVILERLRNLEMAVRERVESASS